jgi:hypothetical protein
VELLFVALGGAVLGLAARYILPRRTTQGWALVPAIGTAVASVVWVALTWLGWKWDAGWIWWVSLGLAAVAAFASDIVIAQRRYQRDQRLLHTLMKGSPRRA